MKICIIGQGAAGWMAATALSNRFGNELEVIIVGSKEIKTIGVGESNTWALVQFHEDAGVPEGEFIRHSDAAVKLGVYYKNWGGWDFLHNFKHNTGFSDYILLNHICESLTNKSDDVSVTDIIAPELWKQIHHNKMPVNDMYYDKSWHFDAAKYISFLENFNLKNRRVKAIEDTVVDCKFRGDEDLESIILKSGEVITADYFVFATGGSSGELERKLGEKYIDLSNILLTDKAIVLPLDYTDKRKEFHPYTVAKAMNYGWRWITPTYSRIGTGYVFSSNHVSEDQVIDEFLTDIGDKTLEPKVVDFKPRYNTKTFKTNYCTIGMANGFLEPLDAPGLALTTQAIAELVDLLSRDSNLRGKQNEFLRSHYNNRLRYSYKNWAAFILNQYKTSTSISNNFWDDHRNIQWEHYDLLWKSFPLQLSPHEDFSQMFYHTSAARNYHWKTEITGEPIPQRIPEQEWVHHLDYINEYHRTEQNTFESQIAWMDDLNKENIWELNDDLEVKEEVFEDSKIYYIDNFYKQPEKVLKEITSKNPPLWKITEPYTLNSLMFEDRRLEMKYKQLTPVYEFISSITNQPPQHNQPDKLVTNNLLLYRHPYNDFESNYWWPHRDVGYTAILYLNEDCDGKTGTNLYKALGEDPGYGPEHYAPWRSKEYYDRIKYLESKFNRLVLFDGAKFLHGANIETDVHMKDRRINQVFFFESVDS